MRAFLFPTPPCIPEDDLEKREHASKIAMARGQLAESRRQLDAASRLTEPIARTAAELREARDRNHFSEMLADMLQGDSKRSRMRGT